MDFTDVKKRDGGKRREGKEGRRGPGSVFYVDVCILGVGGAVNKLSQITSFWLKCIFLEFRV